MKTSQYLWQNGGWVSEQSVTADIKPQITLIFGNRDKLSDQHYFNEIKQLFPGSNIAICSTAGEIYKNRVLSGSISATAVEFEKTEIQIKKFDIQETGQSEDIGKQIANHFDREDLKLLFVLSDGQTVNGGDLIIGINSILKGKVPVTGGLAGDEDRFEKTLVGLNEMPSENNIVAFALYGDRIKVGHGSKGGWDAFGPERVVTKSSANVLYELDNQSALDLYKEYLGEKAKELPGSALLFPLNLLDQKTGNKVVRTILTVNEEDKSMTFAGNIPEGSKVRLMKANFDRLIDGSANAANDSIKMYLNEQLEPELAILVSCVGRKLVLGQMVTEEIEEAVSVIGKGTCYTGLYSYGEISPLVGSNSCELHNQTMTITTLHEL